MPRTRVERTTVAPRPSAATRKRALKRKQTRMAMTVIETWKLGKQLSRPLIGRMASMRCELKLSESRIAPEPGKAQRSGIGSRRKNGRLTA
jgi:hypothetical protein